MKYKITEEMRQFIREMRYKDNVSTDTIRLALDYKSTATYNNIENSNVKNALKTIELSTIFKIISSIRNNNADKTKYENLDYQLQLNFSKVAKEVVASFNRADYCTDIRCQAWIIAFQLQYVFFDIPKDVLDVFEKYKRENNLSSEEFLLLLNKNTHLLSLRGFKDTNSVEIKSDIEGNYLDWGIKYKLDSKQIDKYINAKVLPYHMIYSLLFNCYYCGNRTKAEVSKLVLEDFKKNNICILTDAIKEIYATDNNIKKNDTELVERVNEFLKYNKDANQIMEKIINNMQSENYFELMSMPIFATLIHFTPDKMSKLKDMIMKDITQLL